MQTGWSNISCTSANPRSENQERNRVPAQDNQSFIHRQGPFSLSSHARCERRRLGFIPRERRIRFGRRRFERNPYRQPQSLGVTRARVRKSAHPRRRAARPASGRDPFAGRLPEPAAPHHGNGAGDERAFEPAGAVHPRQGSQPQRRAFGARIQGARRTARHQPDGAKKPLRRHSGQGSGVPGSRRRTRAAHRSRRAAVQQKNHV